MFELLIQAITTINEGAILQVDDVSDWTASGEGARASYATFLTGELRLADDPSAVLVNSNEPETDIVWDVNTPSDGRYSFTEHAFYIKDVVVPIEADVHYDPVGDALVQWISSAWVAITLDEAITQGKAVYTSAVLEVPYLAYSYIHANFLNLAYIKEVKYDIMNGARQNKLYYKRTDLDYFKSLITGGEYNWALGLYNNYYDIVNNLNAIISSGQIS